MVNQQPLVDEVSVNDGISKRKVIKKSCLYVSKDVQVEDANSVAVISRQLEDMGYKVMQTSDVSSAKKMCEMNFYSLIVLEELKDEDFIRQIKSKNSCNEQTPVLYIVSCGIPETIKNLMQDQFLDEVVFKCSTLESDLAKAVSQLTIQQGNFAITPRSKRTDSAMKKRKTPNIKAEGSNDTATAGSYLNMLQTADLPTVPGNGEPNKEGSWTQHQMMNTADQLQMQAFDNYYGSNVAPNFHVPMNAAYQPFPSGSLTNLNSATLTLDSATLHAIAAGASELPNFMWPGTAPLSAMALHPFASSLAPELNYEFKQPKIQDVDEASTMSGFIYPSQNESASSVEINTNSPRVEHQSTPNASLLNGEDIEINQSTTENSKSREMDNKGSNSSTFTAKQERSYEKQVGKEINSNINKTVETPPRVKSTVDSRKRKNISKEEKLNRKKAHLDLEKKRRERITKCWHWLRQIIPFCDQSADKATVFEMTVAYIYHCWKHHSNILPEICKEFELTYASSGSPEDLDDMVEDILKQEGKSKAAL